MACSTIVVEGQKTKHLADEARHADEAKEEKAHRADDAKAEKASKGTPYIALAKVTPYIVLCKGYPLLQQQSGFADEGLSGGGGKGGDSSARGGGKHCTSTSSPSPPPKKGKGGKKRKAEPQLVPEDDAAKESAGPARRAVRTRGCIRTSKELAAAVSVNGAKQVVVDVAWLRICREESGQTQATLYEQNLSCATSEDAVELELHSNSSPWTELAMHGTGLGKTELKEYGNFSQRQLKPLVVYVYDISVELGLWTSLSRCSKNIRRKAHGYIVFGSLNTRGSPVGKSPLWYPRSHVPSSDSA
ncbi:hypothetical protein B0H13DRAFT_1905613 [Mycena leptocephala]|nr:hypothetical protein B0H13DRAFT_1905613 [Mycena leptocephala]